MLFEVRSDSSVPKYQQIIDGVINAIRSGKVCRGAPLPSASVLCREFNLARETVIKAYAELKGMGIVNAVPRKGYFVATESVAHTRKVMLLFDEFSPYKQDLYDAFRDHVGTSVVTDIFFHHCDVWSFKSLFLDKIDYYSLCLVMPFEDQAVAGVLKLIDPNKLLILDRIDHIQAQGSFIGQDHDAGLFAALTSGADLLEKYAQVNLVFPQAREIAMHSSQAPLVIPEAFKRFCREHKIRHRVLPKVGQVKQGEAWFVIDDADLVDVVEQAREKHFTLGKDLGILAYNETAMRKIVGKGITVVSTDFQEMGCRAAEFVLNPTQVRYVVPTRLIRRKSL